MSDRATIDGREGGGPPAPGLPPRSGWRGTWGLRVFADRRFVGLALGFVLAIALAYRAVQFVAFVSAPQWGYDFSAYWLAARHLLDGDPIYTATQLVGPYPPQGQFLYLYPPFLAALAIPFALLSPDSYGPAMAVWALGGAVIAVAVVIAVARLEGLALDPARAAFLLAGAFAFPPLVAELALGNVHVLLLGLLAFAWWALRRGGPRGEALAGLAIGAAALIKLFPAVVVLWLLLTGRRRAFAWSVAACVGLALLTIPLTGIDAWLQYPRVVADLGPPADVTDALAPAVWLSGIVPVELARVLVIAAGLGLVAWSAVRLAEAPSYGVAVAASVLMAPAVFQHYLALMILPLLLALRPALAGPATARLAFGASYLAMWAGQQPVLGAAAWVLNRAIPTLGALGVPTVLLRWGPRTNVAGPGAPAREAQPS